MSTPLSATGSQAAAGGASSATRSQAAARPSDSGALPSDSATAGTADVIEINDDVRVGCKRKLKSKVWLEFDRV